MTSDENSPLWNPVLANIAKWIEESTDARCLECKVGCIYSAYHHAKGCCLEYRTLHEYEQIVMGCARLADGDPARIEYVMAINPSEDNVD